MSDKPNGGTAFPCEGGEYSGLYADPGMTLRDYFAAKAMQAIICNSESLIKCFEISVNKGIDLSEYASKEAYEIADAMLKEREK